MDTHETKHSKSGRPSNQSVDTDQILGFHTGANFSKRLRVVTNLQRLQTTQKKTFVDLRAPANPRTGTRSRNWPQVTHNPCQDFVSPLQKTVSMNFPQRAALNCSGLCLCELDASCVTPEQSTDERVGDPHLCPNWVLHQNK